MFSIRRVLTAAPRQLSARSLPLTLTRPIAFSPFRLSSTTTASSPNPPASLTDGEQALKDKLESSLEGAKVEVQDVSGGCGSFFAISIAHSSFKGLTTVKQHRMVNELLKDEIKGMHGLQLKTTAE